MRIAFAGDSLTRGSPGSSYFAILQQRLEHTLVNLGEGNDTVISLYRRLTRLHWGEPFDLAFLWVGVNDAARASPWTFRLVSLLANKPPSKNPDEFRAFYRANLVLLSRHARRVVTVSPLLKGEDIGNPWNRELENMSRIIQELTRDCAQAEYLDLRPAFIGKLAGKRISNYVPKSVIGVFLDALILRTDEQSDKRAAERGLHFTLDGIHLNSVGAERVAEAFSKKIGGCSGR